MALLGSSYTVNNLINMQLGMRGMKAVFYQLEDTTTYSEEMAKNPTVVALIVRGLVDMNSKFENTL